MGLIDKKHIEYYTDKSSYGEYQFTSLDDIITNFMVAYVGEDKIISKARRVDVSFHAHRAMQELSFDTFKSFKSQEIVLPNTLQMVLPHDYVNYVKLSWSDDSGIEHVLYPTDKTSNPNTIRQNNVGRYIFKPGQDFVLNLDFEDGDDGLNNWTVQGHTDANSNTGRKTQSHRSANAIGNNAAFPINQRDKYEDTISADSGLLTFKHHNSAFSGTFASNIHCAYQLIDVTGVTLLNISAKGSTAQELDRTDLADGDPLKRVHDGGILRIGLTTQQPDVFVKGNQSGQNVSQNQFESLFDIGFLEWNNEPTAAFKQLIDDDSLNVSSYNQVYLVVVSFVPFENFPEDATAQVNTIDDILVETDASVGMLQTTPSGNSTTFTNYKKDKPSENSINDYKDYENNIYWPNQGKRYGLEPQHAQVNGSFYIDTFRGLIHFSSNVAGKTLLLKYISDSLGTDEEMQVHKFAEEAMYKWLMHAILSTKQNVPEYQVARYKKERRAAMRQAKLRLSNIKLEEIAQILRGKSKHIKH